MAKYERPERLPTAGEKLAEILRTHRPLRYEDTMGPPPEPGDTEDLEAFRGTLETQHQRPGWQSLSEE